MIGILYEKLISFLGPDSFIEVLKILPLLAQNGPDGLAFHVIALSLSNYAVAKYAEVLMLQLRYGQYVTQGGDCLLFDNKSNWRHVSRQLSVDRRLKVLTSTSIYQFQLSRTWCCAADLLLKSSTLSLTVKERHLMGKIFTRDGAAGHIKGVKLGSERIGHSSIAVSRDIRLLDAIKSLNCDLG